MNQPENPSVPFSVEIIEKSKPQKLSSEPDEKSRDEAGDLELKRQALVLRGEEQDIRERKVYAVKFYRMALGWVIGLGLLLFLQGFGTLFHFNLSDRVLMMALGTTTGTVLGMIYIVAKYLFPKRRFVQYE